MVWYCATRYLKKSNLKVFLHIGKLLKPEASRQQLIIKWKDNNNNNFHSPFSSPDSKGGKSVPVHKSTDSEQRVWLISNLHLTCNTYSATGTIWTVWSAWHYINPFFESPWCIAFGLKHTTKTKMQGEAVQSASEKPQSWVAMVTRTLNHLDLLLHCPWPISAQPRANAKWWGLYRATCVW